KNINTLINHVHQASFKALLKASRDANAGAALAVEEREVALINAGEEALLEKGRIVHPALRAILAAGKDISKGLIVLNGEQIAYHAKLGFHSAELLVKLADADDGGFLRMRYS